MNNRILSIILCVIVCVTMFTTSLTVSARASTMEFSLETTQGGVGDTVTVTVNISPDSYFTNATILLHYNKDAVQFATEGTGSVSPSSAMFLVQDYPREGTVKGAYVAVKPIKKGGSLLTYDFTVLKEIEAGFSLSFEECIGEDENGNMFDVSYTSNTCVLNQGKGTPVVTTTNSVPNSARTTTTRSMPKATTTSPAGTTTGGKVVITTTAPQGTAPTAPPVTYPTDTNGITLAPNVVTEPNGNAATEPNGAVVTAYVMTTVAPVQSEAEGLATTTMPTDENGEPIEQSGQLQIPGESDSSNWVVPVIVLVVAFLIAGGAALFIIIKRKKANANANANASDEPTSEE